jgi:hypothetical protein
LISESVSKLWVSNILSIKGQAVDVIIRPVACNYQDLNHMALKEKQGMRRGEKAAIGARFSLVERLASIGKL